MRMIAVVSTTLPVIKAQPEVTTAMEALERRG